MTRPVIARRQWPFTVEPGEEGKPRKNVHYTPSNPPPVGYVKLSKLQISPYTAKDPGGCPWVGGTEPNGMIAWVCYNKHHRLFFRARDRVQAKRTVLSVWPDVKFHR